jgi:NAD(P)-dependent dehydrogenase (short-subunit alcohol dehydrogenase family)
VTRPVAIVTGASRGIGRQIAVALGAAGFDVVVAARTVDPHRRLPGTIGETVTMVEATGAKALAVRTDLTVPSDLTALVEQTIAAFGRLDVLVNNAADTSGGTPKLVGMVFEDWLRQFDANLHGPARLMQAAIEHLERSGSGLIVNLTSSAADLVAFEPLDVGGTAGVLGGERLAYAASKAALNRLANAAAAELAASGIAIVNVDPGYTRTELVDLMAERGVVDPTGSVPMEIPTAVVRFLATSGRAMEFTGQILRAAAFAEEHRL